MSDDFVVLGGYADEEGGLAYLSDEDRRRSLYILGRSGTGKSTLIHAMADSDLRRHRGFALLDLHGDLAEQIADTIPIDRENSTIYVDPADPAACLAFNPLHAVAPDARALVASQIVEVFSHIWDLSPEATPRLLFVLYNSLRLLLDAPAATLLGIQRLLVDELWRRKLLTTCRDPAVRSFWEQQFGDLSDRDAALVASSLQNKVGMLLAGPLRSVLGQARPTIDLRRVMDRGEALILNLSKAKLGEGPARLLGSFMLSAFLQAAASRADTPESERRPFTLYCDEFHGYAHKGVLSGITESRKWGLVWVLSHQLLAQLPPLLARTVIGTIGSLIVFRIAGEDAESLQADLRNSDFVYDQTRLAHVNIAPPINFANTPNFYAWAKLLDGGVPTETRLIATTPPAPAITGRFAAVRARSCARHMRPRELVEKEINHFLDPAPSTLDEVHMIVGRPRDRGR